MADDLCEELLDDFEATLEDLENTDAPESYKGSLQEKYESMRAWYDDKASLTDRQMDAIQNMIDGARKWIRD